MNEITTQNATLPASLAGFRDPLPTAWIERLFSRFEGLYGSKFHDAWRGTDLENVKAVWAEKLSGFADKPGCLKAALDACDDKPWPPTLPEFLAMCRDAARRIGTSIALPAPTLSRDEARKRMNEINARYFAEQA